MSRGGLRRRRSPQEAAIKMQAHFRGFRTRKQVMNTVASIKLWTSSGTCRLMQIVHAIRVFGGPCTDRRPVDTAMLTQLFTQLERNAYTRDQHGHRQGEDLLDTDVGFFTSKDDVEQERILDSMKLVCYEAGATVFDQDQLSDGKFFFVLGGEVEIKIVHPGASASVPPKLLKLMSSGSSFGDRTMSTLGATRTASVRTVTDCILGVLQRADFLRITHQFFDLAVTALETRPEERTGEHITLVDNVLKDCAFFRGLQFKTLASGIVKSCTHKRVRKNELLFKEGDEAKCFYVVVRGHVRVVKNGDAVAVLGPGQSFGEKGVTGTTANERRRTATIVAGAVPGVPGSPLERGLQSPTSGGATPSGARTPGGSRRSELSYTDLAVISRDDYLRLQGGTDDAVARALRERPANRTEQQMDLLHTLCSSTSFFRTLGSRLVEYKCCRYMQMQKNAPGDVLFSEGDPAGETFYIVIRGSVSGSIEADNTRFQLGVGDSFGDLALRGKTEAERIRTATIVCREETMFATLSRVDYLRVSGELHNSALEILNTPPDERSQANVHILAGYLSELQFFRDMHFPLLQQAVCQRLQLLSLRAGEVLYNQGDASNGRYYMLLQGSMTQKAPQARKHQQYKNLTVPNTWGDSANALHPKSDKALTDTMFQCSRTVTALPLQDGAPSKASLTIKVTGFPDSWKAVDLFKLFARFGPVITVQIHTQKGRYASRSAEIGFADRDAAERAKEGGEIAIRSVNVQQQNNGDMSVIQDCVPDRFAKPELVQGPGGGRVSMERTRSSENLGAPREELINEEVLLCTDVGEVDDKQALDQADVLVAFLTREDYLECFHAVITKVMDILASPPRIRTPEQLLLVRNMFSSTDLIQRLCSSNLVQRNCCRFLGISTAATRETILKKGQSANRCYTILTGRIDLYDILGEEPLERGPGAFFGDETLRSLGKEQYERQAVARSPAVLAVMSKSDYFRICHTEDVQAVIDKFWTLGLGNSKSGHPSLLDFAGYKQVYLRLGKVIATKKMFSQKELRATMKRDWESDLELFGDPQLQALTHEQYTDSMYQFIDEWSNAVESTKLYEELLQLILDNMTTLNPNTGDLKLTPLPKIQCCYQRILDMTHAHERQVKAVLRDSTVGKLEIGQADHVSHFKDMFSKKGIFQQGHAVEETEEDLTVKGILDREMTYIKEMFNSVDVDGSGSIDRGEVGQLSKKMGWDLTELELDAALVEMDPSGDGEVDLEEFTSWVRRYTEGDDMVRRIFETVDEDGSGVLDYDEVEMMLSELGVDSAHLDDAIAAMDEDGNENVDVDEFITWWRGFNSTQVLEKVVDPVESYYRGMFDRADKDGNGHVDALELEFLLSCLGMPVDPTSMQLALAVMDENHDGTIVWEEFKAWLDNIIATETEVSEFCESSGIDTSQGGILSFEKARNTIDFLCERNSHAHIDDEKLLAQVFPPGSTQDSGDTVSFEVLSKWWLAYQSDPQAGVSPQPVPHKTLVDADDDVESEKVSVSDPSNVVTQAAEERQHRRTKKRSESIMAKRAQPHKTLVGADDDVESEKVSVSDPSNSVTPSEGGWEASGGAGEVWTVDGWVSVGEPGQDEPETEVKAAATKRVKSKKKIELQVDVKRRAPKKMVDAQLLADAEAAEERQRRRAKKRSERMLAKRSAAMQKVECQTSTSQLSPVPSARSTEEGPSLQQVDEFSDFIVKAQPRPKTTEPGQRSGIHSSSYRRLPTAPYLPHAAHCIAPAKRRSIKHSQNLDAQFGLGSQSMPDLGRPAHMEWRERDITIVPDGDEYVAKMPSVPTPARGPQQSDKDTHESDVGTDYHEVAGADQESDVYREYIEKYRETEEVTTASQREERPSMLELYEHGLVVEYKKLALQQPHQQQRGSRMAHTDVEREFYETVNWEFQGPSPRSSPTSSPRLLQRIGTSYSKSEAGQKTVPTLLCQERPCISGLVDVDSDDVNTGLDLSIAGGQSPRHYSPCTSTQVEAVKAVAGVSSPFVSPRSRQAAKAMLLDQAQIAGILARANLQRTSMRERTPASFAPDVEARKLPPGAVAKKFKLGTREKYKSSSERTDRNVLQWFAEHGSAKRSMKTMSRGPCPQRKGFTRDWRNPPGCEWKLSGTEGASYGRKSNREIQAEFNRLHRPSASSVLGVYGRWPAGNDDVAGAQGCNWRAGGLGEQDCLWNEVVQNAPAGTIDRPATSPKSSAILW